TRATFRRAASRRRCSESACPTHADLWRVWPAPAGLRRSCRRSCSRASAVRRGEGCEEGLDDLAVLLVVEILLDNLRGARDREIHRLAPQLRDCLVALGRKLATCPLAH